MQVAVARAAAEEAVAAVAVHVDLRPSCADAGLAGPRGPLLFAVAPVTESADSAHSYYSSTVSR